MIRDLHPWQRFHSWELPWFSLYQVLRFQARFVNIPLEVLAHSLLWPLQMSDKRAWMYRLREVSLDISEQRSVRGGFHFFRLSFSRWIRFFGVSRFLTRHLRYMRACWLDPWDTIRSSHSFYWRVHREYFELVRALILIPEVPQFLSPRGYSIFL